MNPVFPTLADMLAEQGYAVTDQFLSQTEVSEIINLPDFKNSLIRFKKAGIGKSDSLQINEAIRGDYIQWIDPANAPSSIQVYLDRISQLTRFLNEQFFLSLKDFEVHQTVYPAGSFYKRHLDQFKQDDHRKLSVICYLNNAWEVTHGGQLRIYLPKGSVDILPLAGRLVCFRSDQLEHEVLPATRDRMSLTGWMLDQYADLKHL